MKKFIPNIKSYFFWYQSFIIIAGITSIVMILYSEYQSYTSDICDYIYDGILILIEIGFWMLLKMCKRNQKKSFYEECVKNGIKAISTNADKQKAEAIAQKPYYKLAFGNELSDIKQFFKESKRLAAKDNTYNEEKYCDFK